MELSGSLISEQIRWGSPERMKVVIQALDAQAEAYLDLVADMESQEAFSVVLEAFAHKAFEKFTGHRLGVLIPLGNEFLPIEQRVRYWVNESYKRIIKQHGCDAPAESSPRRKLIEPILAHKGWSVLDWANEAAVSHATAMDYLDGKTTPYADTRRKLAEALGLAVEQLPK